jgi:hypothetical protein
VFLTAHGLECQTEQKNLIILSFLSFVERLLLLDFARKAANDTKT